MTITFDWVFFLHSIKWPLISIRINIHVMLVFILLWSVVINGLLMLGYPLPWWFRWLCRFSISFPLAKSWEKGLKRLQVILIGKLLLLFSTFNDFLLPKLRKSSDCGSIKVQNFLSWSFNWIYRFSSVFDWALWKVKDHQNYSERWWTNTV